MGRDVMTAIGSKPQPLRDRRNSGTGERSLTEILSLTDAWKFIPESLGLIALIQLAEVWLTAGPTGTSGMPHPFWIPVLLMSGQYGIMGGLFATLAATAVFFIGGLPAQSAAQDFYDYAGIVAVQPCAWFGTALVLGGLRTLHMHHQADLQERYVQTELMAEDLADGLERAVSEIERSEKRIATDYSTLTSLLHSLTKLEVGDRRSLIGSFGDVIRLGVGATSFAVYLDSPHGLEPCVGIEDGVRVSRVAIPQLPAALHHHDDTGDTGIPPAPNSRDIPSMPLWAPIRLADGKSTGVVVCTRLHPSQDPAVASRRLHEICCVLAVMLSACSTPIFENR
jgi:hypothetical protein